MTSTKKYLHYIFTFVMFLALSLPAQGDILADTSESYAVGNAGAPSGFVAFNKTTPANGATINTPSDSYYVLRWTDALLPSTDRYQYCIDQTPDDLCDGNNWITRNSLYSGSPNEFILEPSKTYYWQVRARGAGIEANGGTWWSFSTSAVVPSFSKTTPAIGTIPMPASTYYLLQWTNLFLPSTDRYQYCIDQTNDNLCDGNNWITRNSLYSGTGEFTLAYGATYYWQVRSRDSGVYADSGAWRSFSIAAAPVGALNKTTPANNTLNLPLPASTLYLLRWTDLYLPSTDRYQYCIDQTPDNLCDGNNWITRNSLYSGTGEFSLAQGKTYYWQVRSRDSGVYADSGAWHAFTISGVAPVLNKTTPTNDAMIGMPASTYYFLQWTNLFLPSTDRYQYCIDQTPDNLCDGNNWITRNSLYSGPGEFTLNYGSTYYWQVRSRDSGVYANSGTWHKFTVSAVAPTLNKTTPVDGAIFATPVSTYYLLQWTDLYLPSTDRYQYCIDQTNDNLCDGNNWITRNSLYSGTAEFTLNYGSEYFWQVRTRDSGVYADLGNWRSFKIAPFAAAPSVLSIVRASPNGTNAATVDFTVTFDQVVTGVNTNDFNLSPTIADASITAISGSGTTYTLTVNTGSVSGTLRLNFVDDDSVKNNQNSPVGGVGIGNGSYDFGEIYTITKP